MGLISRQGTAPIVDGETSSGTEVEAELNTLFTEFNGNMDNANFKAAANIGGTKLADNTVTNAKILADTLTVAKMAASAVPKFHTDVSIVTDWTTSSSLTDITNCTDAILTPGSTNDMIFMDITLTIRNPTTGTGGELIFGWHINSTDFNDIHRMDFEDTAPLGGQHFTFQSTYMIIAPAASSMTIKPRHRRTGDSSPTINITHGVFRCWILPGKA